jgi:ABC-type branched-subunit amino acid transport system permease subunit
VPIPNRILPELLAQLAFVKKLHAEDLAAGFTGVFLEDQLEKKYPNAAKEFPWQWWNSDSFWWCAMLVIVVPGLLAFVFGYFAFRSRVKGVYFSIITQALTYAAMLLFFRNATGFGGNNGFTDFKRILDIPIAFITERYLEYLDLMKSLNLDVVSEFLLMAATLVQLKSRLLLPPSEQSAEGGF